MTQSIFRDLFKMVFRFFLVILSKQFLVLLDVCFDVSELLEQFVVLQNFKIFHMIVDFVGSFELTLWLSRVDTLQDGEPSEVFQRELHLSNGLAPGEILGLLSTISLLYFPHFYFLKLIFNRR